MVSRTLRFSSWPGILLLAASLMLVLVACQPEQALPMDKDIKAVLDANITALNTKNIDAYMNTIDPKSAGFAPTKQMTAQLFAAYDLKYVIESMSLLTKTDKDASVRVVQVTTKIRGPDFKDNRIRVVHHLIKAANGWKITDTTVEDVTYLGVSTPTKKA